MSVRVQCPIASSLGEFPSYWDWLWCPGLSAVLVSIALPFAFHTWCFPFALICHWISIVFLLYGRRTCIATHSIEPSRTHFLGEFPGLGLALVPDVVVAEAEERCAWSRKLDPNFCPGRFRTSDLGVERPLILQLDYRAPLLLGASYDTLQQDSSNLEPAWVIVSMRSLYLVNCHSLSFSLSVTWICIIYISSTE